MSDRMNRLTTALSGAAILGIMLALLACETTNSGGSEEPSLGEKIAVGTCNTPWPDYLALACPAIMGPLSNDQLQARGQCFYGARIIHDAKELACIIAGRTQYQE